MVGDREGATVRSTAAAGGAGTSGARAHGAGMRRTGTDRDVLGVLGRVLETARLYGWTDARIIAASDATGYCAIAVAAHKGGGVVVGVALGKRSATEADTLAIQHCLKAGGINPRVRWGWYG